MAKQSGLGDRLLVAGYDLSGDVGSIQRIGDSTATLDVTGINASGMERIHGLIDGAIEFSSFFNKEDGQEHAALAAKGSGADRVCVWLHGATIGAPAAGLVSKQINYDPNRAQDGSLTIGVQMLANGKGLEHCLQLTPGLRIDTAATNGDELDGGAQSTTGLAAYLEVTAFDGTDATVKIQESSDDGGSDAYADVTGGGFTQVTDVGAQRIVTSLTATIERYLRAVTTSSGGVNSITFSVVVTRTPNA